MIAASSLNWNASGKLEQAGRVAVAPAITDDQTSSRHRDRPKRLYLVTMRLTSPAPHLKSANRRQISSSHDTAERTGCALVSNC